MYIDISKNIRVWRIVCTLPVLHFLVLSLHLDKAFLYSLVFLWRSDRCPSTMQYTLYRGLFDLIWQYWKFECHVLVLLHSPIHYCETVLFSLNSTTCFLGIRPRSYTGIYTIKLESKLSWGIIKIDILLNTRIWSCSKSDTWLVLLKSGDQTLRFCLRIFFSDFLPTRYRSYTDQKMVVALLK